MNRVILFLVSSAIAILLGWGTGSYITYNKTMEAVGKIPASPIVVNVSYNKSTHSVIYSMFNPGTLPLTITAQSFIFKPGKETSEKKYSVQNIPVNIPLIPLGITTVSLKLKKGTKELMQGDIVQTTFHYKHPLSTDVYTVTHTFEYEKKENK